MARPITIKRVVTRVRQRVQDTGAINWTDDEVVEAIGQEFETIWTSQNLSGEDHMRDRLEFAPSLFTQVEPFWHEMDLPVHIGGIEQVEGTTNDNSRSFVIPEISLGFREHLRAPYQSGFPGWSFTGLSVAGKLSIFGEINSYTKIRIWFHRRWPNVHYGTIRSTDTTTAVILDTTDSTRSGDLVRRDDVYNGLLIEIDTDVVQSANVDALRRVTDYVGSTATVTLDSAFPATTTTGITTYSFVVPMEPEHENYLVQLAANQLFRRLGNDNYLIANADYTMHLENRFRSGLSSRSNAPMRLHSTRR